MRVCGVILSGGVSKRFGGDKALALLSGEPLIRHVAKSLHEAVDEVWLSVKDDERGEQLMKACEPFVKGYIVDEFSAGPLSGFLSAAKVLGADVMVTSPADAPRIKPTTFQKLVEKFLNHSPAVASVVWGNGAVETLVQVLAVEAVKNYLETVYVQRAGLHRPSDMLRSAGKTLLVAGFNLSSDPYEFSNINTREDLVEPKPRASGGNRVRDDLLLTESSPHFHHAAAAAAEKRFKESAQEYISEALVLLSYGVAHLAGHALIDAAKRFEAAQLSEAASLCSGMEAFIRRDMLSGMR
ncbi:MAG: molybdenum cofactor guanylyltransferase [Candidatus Caldarchaeum sp.]